MNYNDKTAKFVIKKNKAGEYYFNLVAENGEIVATSEGYETRQGAYNGINAVRRCAVARKVEDTVKAVEIEVKDPEPVTADEPPKEEYTMKKLMAMKKNELEKLVAEAGLDPSGYGNKKELSNAILDAQ